MKKIFFLMFLFSNFVNAQYNYRDSNRIGIIVGANQFSPNSSKFDVNSEIGWNAGLSIRGNFYNDFDMVYAMQFSENNFSLASNGLGSSSKDVKYTLQAAQISLQLSYKIVENHLSVEFGPVVQVNGKLKIKDEDKLNVLNNSTLKAGEIIDVSKFNFYPAIGVTAGVKHVRLNLQYQYGLNNFFGNLNNKGYGVNLKSHPSILSANLIFYL